MSNLKATPGPWRAVGGSILAGSNDKIAACYGMPRDQQMLADALLIAAAPELYASLRGLLIAFQSDGPFPRESIERAEAAIAKARGDLAEVVGGQHDPL